MRELIIAASAVRALMAHANLLDVLAKLGELSTRVPPLDVLPRALGTGVNRL